jgi:hypothetical protein
MDEGTPLDSILNEEPAAETVTVEAEQPQEPEQPTDGPARGPDGKFVSKQQDTGVTEEPPPGKLPQDEYKAIREEREKRQRLEAELADLRNQFQSLQQPKEPETPPPSLWEDEQGWQQHFGQSVVTTAVQQATMNAKLDMSEMMMRQANPDFDEIKDTFLTLAKDNPALAEQALADPHPWNKAYHIAKNHKTMADLGATDLDSLKAKIREELMAEMQSPAAAQSMVPPSLSGVRNVGSRSGPVWSGPTPLGDMLR